jgi:two-component system chemotaxis response regulator CheY
LAEEGREALRAYSTAYEEGNPCEFICLDIMMPITDGQEVLCRIRQMEKRNGVLPQKAVKIIMTTALSDKGNVLRAIESYCDGYILKPFRKEKMIEELVRLGLIEGGEKD